MTTHYWVIYFEFLLTIQLLDILDGSEMASSRLRHAQSDIAKFSQSRGVKYAFLCATLVLIAILIHLSWGQWLTLFTVVSGPAAITVAWIAWGRNLSAWSLAPAFVQALYDISWLVSFQNYAASDPRTYDLFLFFVDGSFGFEPSIAVRHAVDHVPLLHGLFFYAYSCLPLAMALAYIAHLRAKKRLLYIPIVLGVAIFGTLLYNLLPACGPVSLLGTAQFAGDCGPLCSNIRSMTPDLDSYSFNPSDPRNAMPSLHVTWALLTFWICRDLKWGRWVAGLFLFCTIVSTLFTGEHYLVDVVAAFPLALIVWHVCVGEVPRTDPRRLLPILCGVTVLLLWIGSIRFDPQLFWLSPVLPWSSAVLTVGGSLWAVSRHPYKTCNE